MESNPRPTLRGRKLLILRYSQTSKVARTASFGDAVVTRSREQSILRKPEIHMDGNGVYQDLASCLGLLKNPSVLISVTMRPEWRELGWKEENF